MICHVGMYFGGGHFLAYVRSDAGTWIKYNDAGVTDTFRVRLESNYDNVDRDCALLLYKRGHIYRANLGKVVTTCAYVHAGIILQ